MLGKPVKFKNAHALYHVEELEKISSSKEDMERLIEDIKSQNVGEVYFLSSDRRTIGEIAKSISELNIHFHTLDREKIDNEDMDYIKGVNQGLLKTLKSMPVLILHDGRLDKKIINYLATILITIGDSRLAPELCIKLFTQDQSARPSPDLAERYADFIHKRIRKPEKPPVSREQKITPPQETKEGEVPSIEKKGASQPVKLPSRPDQKAIMDELRAEDKKGEVFKPSRMSLRVKLAAITSSIIVLAAAMMIVPANRLFRDNIAVLIQEYNLSLARLTGRKVEDQLRGITEQIRTTDRLLARKGKPSEEEEFIRQFFKENPEYIFFGIVESQNGIPTPVWSYLNDEYVRTNDISLAAVNELKRSYGELYMISSSGELAIENTSPSFGHPVMIVGVPDGRKEGRMLVAYLNSSSLMESFRSTRASEIFQVMMVNNKGLVIAHTDDRETLARSNLNNVPIVKSMLESGSGNGSRIYEVEGREYLGAYQNMSIGGLSVVSTVDSEEVFHAVNLIRIQNVIITAIALTLAFLGIFFFARTISKPIVNLVDATKEIEQGNYNLKIKPTTHDEVGILTEAFRHMSRGLAERELIKDTFGKFVNEEIVERALHEGIQLGGDKRIATVLFCDMRNFTPLAESRDPARVVELLNGYFTGMVECVHNTGGIVDKFIGDAIMAHWGSIQTAENDTEESVNAALQMRDTLIRFNSLPENHDLPTIHVGIGINTGMVIAGQIGSERKLEFTVIGDTVNLASRIEFLNKHFGTDILISSATYEFVKDIFDLHEMPSISIKGKSKPEIVYAVMGRLDDPTRPRSLNELRKKIGLEFSEEDQQKSMAISTDHLANGSISKKGK